MRPSASPTGGSCRCTCASATRSFATTSTSRPMPSTSGCARRRGRRRPRSRRPVTSRSSTRSSVRTTSACTRCSSPRRSRAPTRARVAAGEGHGDKVRVIDTRTVSAAIAQLAFAVQRRLERGTTDEEIGALIERFRARARSRCGARHARLPRARRPHRACGGVRRDAAQRQADPRGRRRRGRAAEARAREPQGDRGAARSCSSRPPRTSRRCTSRMAHAAVPERLEQLEASVREARPRAQLDVATELGAVVGTHGGPGALGLFWFDDRE